MARVLLRCALDTFTGYGNDGVGLARALDKVCDLRVSPYGVVPPLPQEVADLFIRERFSQTDLTLIHADPFAVTKWADQLKRRSALLVGWTMWEFESITSMKGHSKLKRKYQPFDTFLLYSQLTNRALSPHIPKKTAKHVVQGGYSSEFWTQEPSQERDWTAPFRFCMVGQLHERKDPFVALAAWDILREEYGPSWDATLHLKTQTRHLHPKIEERYPGVKIHYAMWSPQQLLDFYHYCHVYLAPSRGEGKNVPALEAQTTGIPVIATKYGGHENWMNDDWSWSVKYTLQGADYGMCAKADAQDLAEKMAFAYENRGAVREKGRIASEVIPVMLDWNAIVPRVLELLEVS